MSFDVRSISVSCASRPSSTAVDDDMGAVGQVDPWEC